MSEGNEAAESVRQALTLFGVSVSEEDVQAVAGFVQQRRAVGPPRLETEPQLVQVPVPWLRR